MAKLRARGHAYYLEPLGLGGRPAVEAPGTWIGRGSSAFGLRGTVAPPDLEAVLAGTDPDGTALPGADRRRVVVTGFDLTFCAPKSVSLLEALSDPTVSARVQQGHERAVGAAFSYLEDRALAVRRRGGGLDRGPLPSEASPAAAFVHRTSRALDPHLHTHVVLANIARGPDSRWSALDGRGLYAHAAAAGALYQAQLRHELTSSLGVAWGSLAHGRSDVSGIPPEVRRAFSRRAEQIAAHLADRGLVAGDEDGRPSRRAVRVAALATRAPKDLGAGADELRPWWRDRALALGLGPRRLEAVLDRAPRLGAGAPEVARVDGHVVAEAVVAMRGPERTFARRDVVRAWSSALPVGAPSAHVAEVVDRFLDDVAADLGVAAVIPDASVAGDAHRRDAPGVGERRMSIPDRLRQRDLDVLLERRGMARARELGQERGMDLGIG